MVPFVQPVTLIVQVVPDPVGVPTVQFVPVNFEDVSVVMLSLITNV